MRIRNSWFAHPRKNKGFKKSRLLQVQERDRHQRSKYQKNHHGGRRASRYKQAINKSYKTLEDFQAVGEGVLQ